MASNSTEYLRFSAYSLKELITRKLASETKFTDQVYEGSNLAILIDIVCYMYQCLLYNINNAASEAMWSDTQVYENINRLAKLVGYNPKGATPATAPFVPLKDDLGLKPEVTIPKYATIDTKLTDENGKKIYYSTVEDTELSKESDNTVLFYNGKWKLYKTVFVASGQPFQTLQLDSLTSDDSKQTYVPAEFIDLYVMSQNDTAQQKKLVQWTRVQQGLFTDSNVTNGTTIYSNNSKIYNVRLNEDKYYEITFGNGFNGSIPEKGDAIYIFYLDTNGPLGKINLGDVQDGKLKHDAAMLGISDEMYELMFPNSYDSIEYDSNNADRRNLVKNFAYVKDNFKWENVSSSTIGKVEESVDDIRRNAPEQFKLGNRLVTTSDWEYYIRNRFKDNIVSVICQNNWTYVSSFYRWLYNLGYKEHGDHAYYLTQNKLVKYDYKWADAADVNNVYLWIKMKNNADIYKSVIDRDVQGIKVITQEAVYVKPLDVMFAICAQDVDEVKNQLKNNDTSFSGNYLEITIDDNTLYANSDIAQRVQSIIKEFFDEKNFQLGDIVDNNALANKIFELGVISRIRTIYRNTNTGVERIFPGIAFASWTTDFIDVGDDVDVTTVSKSLEPFQFPKLLVKSIQNSIKIIRKSIGSMNFVQY